MLASRKTETAVLRSQGSRSPVVTCSETDPVDGVRARLLGCGICGVRSSRVRGVGGAGGSGVSKGSRAVEKEMSANPYRWRAGCSDSGFCDNTWPSPVSPARGDRHGLHRAPPVT